MRAVVIPELSGPAAATLHHDPHPAGAHDRADGRRILVDVHAAGLSFIDPLQTRGKYQHRLEAPGGILGRLGRRRARLGGRRRCFPRW